MGDAEPGKSHWAVKRIKGITSPKKAIAILGGDNSYHEASSSSYTNSLKTGYKSLNLKRFDTGVNI